MKRVILLADDSATIQRLVTQTFADADVEIVPVSNGDAAIRKFEELRPEVVLADVYMPGKSGYEVCSYIKRHPTRSHIPVVLLAGAFDAFDEGTVEQSGASGHITKPFEPQALVDLVMGLLAQDREAVAPSPAPPWPLNPPDTDRFDDLLGLGDLFQPALADAPPVLSVSDEEIERIADRVIQKLSTQVIESVAWDVVPGITTKVLREELKRQS